MARPFIPPAFSKRKQRNAVLRSVELAELNKGGKRADSLLRDFSKPMEKKS